jgi:sulfatase modifying factor 1
MRRFRPIILPVIGFVAAYLLASTVRHWTAGAADEIPPDMVWVPGGEFTIGSTSPDARPDEQPTHRVRVDGFWIDATEVTNAQFQAFVSATHYVTTAQRAPDLNEIMSQMPPGTPAPSKEMLVPGSLVFTPTDHAVPLDDIRQWWRWTPGADWHHPEGPASSIEGKDDHPVVQVSWDDALAYSTWAGKRLPTEAEWEFAARGGLEGRHFVWGDEPVSDTRPQCNIWQGEFPYNNRATDGYPRTSPVKAFAPNGFGLYGMAGNVWEWCHDWYSPETYRERAGQGATDNPQGPQRSLDRRRPQMPQRSQRGGSFLCNATYCSSYRPSARMGCSPDTGMSHVGFRCVKPSASGPQQSLSNRITLAASPEK